MNEKKKLSLWKKSPALVIGLIITLFFVILALFPGLFTHFSPTDIDVKAIMKPPSAEHWFGTDKFGRDLYTRVIYSTRIDLYIGIVAMLVPFVVGSALGLISGYYGGVVDSLIMRVVDIIMAFPYMLLAIAIVAVFGAGLNNMIISMWLVSWKGYCRLVRSEVLVTKNAEYIKAAKIMGYSDLRIMGRHLLPNVISPAVVLAASDIVMCMLAGAAMSYLGLGVQSPTPEWGAIIAEGRGQILIAAWPVVFPGIFMAVCGLGFSLVGDGVSDLLRTKGH